MTRARLLSALSAAILMVAGCSRSPSDSSIEAGFARDMATHHEQAAEMSFILRDASRDERLRTMAYDIIVTQSAQRGMFMGWLQQWGLPQASAGPRMAWMDAAHESSTHSEAGSHATPGMPLMAGMASATEMDELRRAAGVDAEVLFLKLMIRHHEGGVLMARALLARSIREDVVAVVRGIDSSQTAELALMAEMLAARGGTPFPSLLP